MSTPIDRHIRPVVRPVEQLLVQEPEVRPLSNGVVVKTLKAGDNDVTRMDVVVNGGRWHQTCPLQALFTNQMLREGTARYTSAQVAECLDYYGAWLDLSCVMEHSFVTLYSLNKYLPQTLDLLESILREPAFAERELQTMTDTALQQFRVNCSKVSFLAQRALLVMLYGEEHPCGCQVQEADYRVITPRLLRDFYERYYHAPVTVFLSGNVPAACLHRVEQHFADPWFSRRQATPQPVISRPLTTAGKRVWVERPEASQCAVRMGLLTIGHKHPDYLKLRVLVTLLGGYFGSRLMSNIREEKGYTYGIAAAIYANPDSGFFLISAETAPEYVEPLIGEVYREIDRLCHEPVSEEELSMVKNYMLGDICRSYDSAFALADTWISLQTAGFDGSHIAKVIEAIRTLTPSELLDLANKYLCKENLKEAISGKKIS